MGPAARAVLILLLIPILGSSAFAGEPFIVGASPGTEPAVAALGDSLVVIVYEAGDSIVFCIPGFVPESPVAPAGAGVQVSPDVAALPAGGFVAVWLAGPEGALDPVARIFDQWGNPVSDVIDCGGHGHGVDVSVSAFSDGGFAVSWAELWPPVLEDVFVRIHAAGGAPVGSVRQANEDGTVRNIHPQVAAAPDGGVTVAWGTNDIDDATCVSRRYAGGAWGDLRLLSAAGAFPDAGINGTGRACIAWAATEGKRGAWYLTPEGTAATLGGSDAGTVAVAVHPAGPAVVVWHEGGTGGPGRLRSRFLDGAGRPAGDVFTVTGNTPWVGAPPGVAITPNGRVLFAWEDFDSGRILARWWDEPVVPVTRKSWGSLKGLWR